MTDITALIRAELDAGTRDLNDITRKALNAALTGEDPAESLFGLVRNHASTMLRSYVATAEKDWHAAERQLSSADRRGDHRSEYVNTATEARKKLSVESFYVPGEGSVVWGEATVEQHEAAIQHSEKYIAGYQSDIDRHKKAILQIKTAGVTCMDEIPE
jgi:hypothetical protein